MALDALVMWVVVLLFQPVLGRDLRHAEHTRTAGVVAYGGIAAIEVTDVLDWPLPGWLPLICGVAGLIWTVLVLRAQWRDGRWQRTTVLYGIAALAAPLILTLLGALFARDASLYRDVTVAADVLMAIWLARSAHDLAAPRDLAAPHDEPARSRR